MKILKKNQLALLIISLMLITAGYLNYSSLYNGGEKEVSANVNNTLDLASIGDAELVNANVLEENVVSNDNNASTEKKEKEEEETNSQIKKETKTNEVNYFTNSKLERNIMYSQMIERYQKILDSSNVVAEQKTIAQQEINKINEEQNAIMIAENLLTTKGFTENIIFVNGESVSVIIGKAEASKDEIAQIQNIVSRELKAEVSNIHISVK